jgi:hypothetical protein
MAGIAPIWAGYPKSYTPGRVRAPKLCVIHYTAGNAGPLAAEDGVAYDKRRTDGTSCHIFADSLGAPLQEVPLGDRSHSAYFHGNEIGVHIETCDTVQSRAAWLDEVSYATLVNAAGAARWVCDTLGLPLRLMTVDEVRAAYYDNGPGGMCDHWAVTLAFPEDGGNHTDMGPEFPWDVFMKLVAGEPQRRVGDDMLMVAKSGAGLNGETVPGHTRWWVGDGIYHRETDESSANNLIGAIRNFYGDPRAAILSWGDTSPEAVQAVIGSIPAGTGGGGSGPSFATLVEAARQGAELAEDS